MGKICEPLSPDLGGDMTGEAVQLNKCGSFLLMLILMAVKLKLTALRINAEEGKG